MRVLSSSDKQISDNTEQRICFLCQRTTGKQLLLETWEVVGLGATRIGIRICDGCGMVLQNPVLTREALSKYYQNFSNYTNAEIEGAHSPQDELSAIRQTAFLGSLCTQGNAAFQIGCSHGYLLSVLRSRGWKVSGLDPSRTCAEIAKAKYGIEVKTGFLESFVTQNQFDLVVLTHVLEHFYDPVSALRKIKTLLGSDALLFIEVPVLVRPDLWPNGYFSVEHLQYFSQRSLKNTLSQAGYQVIKEEEALEENLFPVLRVLAKLAPKAKASGIESDFEQSLALTQRYLTQQECAQWERIDALIEREVAAGSKILVWGAGVHTAQLLTRTKLRERCKLVGFVDSDPQKWGQRLGNLPIMAPQDVVPGEGVSLLISSYAKEKEIYASTHDLRRKGMHVIRLYPGNK